MGFFPYFFQLFIFIGGRLYYRREFSLQIGLGLASEFFFFFFLGGGFLLF